MSDESSAPVVPSRWAPFQPSLAVTLISLLYMLVVVIIYFLLSQFESGPRDLASQFALLVDLPTLPYFALAVAMLFSFWLAAPINGALSGESLVRRILIASGIAVVVVYPAEFALYAKSFADLADQSGSTGGLYDIPPGYTQLDALWRALIAAVEFVLFRVPLIAVAAMASWAWQRRSAARAEA